MDELDESIHLNMLDQLNSVKYYDGIAKGYDELYKAEQIKKMQVIKDNLQHNSGRMLDVGCGTFFSNEFFSKDNPIFHVYGIEPSFQLIKRHPKYKQLESSRKIFIGRAQDISDYFKKDFFDVIICVTAAHHFSNSDIAFQNIKDVGKKDAEFVFSLLKSSSEKIKKTIAKFFIIIKEIDEEKDNILFCTKNI